MICPNCSKEFLSGNVCPYCNTEVVPEEKAAEEVVKEAAEEATEEATEEVAEEVAEEATEEAIEEAAEEAVEETTEEAAEEDGLTDEEKAEIEAVLANAEKADKKANAAIKVLCVLVAVAAVIVAFFLGGKLLGNNGDTPAQTDGTDVVTGDVTGDATGSVLDGDYQVNYPKGFDFLGADYSQYITLGEYKGFVFDTESAEVTDEEIMNYITAQVLPSFSVKTEVTDRAAKKGDVVIVDYSGSIDGVVFDGGTAENQQVEIGAGGYIDGFEDGIIGMNIGDTKVVDCFFPETYGAENLAGKTAQFTFTLHSISEKTLPEYNDAFVAANTEYENTAAFEAYIKENLSVQKQTAVEQNKLAQIIEKIYFGCEFKSLPEGLVDDYVYSDIMQVEQMAAMYGMELDDLLMGSYGITAAQYEAEGRAYFTEMLKQKLAVFAIAKAEGITATDSDIALLIPEYLNQFGVATIEEFVEQSSFTEDELLAVIEQDAVEQKTLDFLMENTTFNVVK